MSQKGKIHERFQQQAEGLQQEAGDVANSLLGAGQRPWQVGSLNDWAGDPLDIPGVVSAFDRTEIGQAYADCLSDPANPGTTADTMALKLQSDWLAMQERAFRLRHETSVRSSLHAAARRLGHAHDQGVIRAGVVKYVEDVLKRGS